jgi:hypothetical protein
MPRMNRRPRRLSRAQADLQSLRQRVRQVTTDDLRVEREAENRPTEARDQRSAGAAVERTRLRRFR